MIMKDDPENFDDVQEEENLEFIENEKKIQNEDIIQDSILTCYKQYEGQELTSKLLIEEQIISLNTSSQ